MVLISSESLVLGQLERLSLAGSHKFDYPQCITAIAEQLTDSVQHWDLLQKFYGSIDEQWLSYLGLVTKGKLSFVLVR